MQRTYWCSWQKRPWSKPRLKTITLGELLVTPHTNNAQTDSQLTSSVAAAALTFEIAYQ